MLALHSEALLLSGALILLLLLMAALIRPLPVHRVPGLATIGHLARGLNLSALRIFGASCPSTVMLDWSVKKPSRNLRPGHRLTMCHKLCKGLLWLLLWYDLPCPVSTAPLTSARWYILPLAARAMARPPQDSDPPGQTYVTRRPHLIPPQELTTHVGACNEVVVQDPPEPFEGCDTRVLSLSSPQLRDSQGDMARGSDWLGVYLYTPHYRPLQLALRPKERTLESVLELLINYDQGPDGRLFDTVVPTRPQQFHGCGSFLRFSSSIRGVGTGGLVAILLDLTHVGGHFFSAVLPQEIAFQTLQEYFRPLTTLEDEPLHVFIGCYDQPLSYRSTARLADGDVILVLKQNCGIPSKQTASSLFAPDAIWALPTDCYRLGFCTSVCVLHKDKRYCVPEHHHYGQSLVQYVSDMLRVNPYCTVSCTFPITDLEVQGELCPFVVAVAEVPSPEVTGINRDNARDIFVLLDPRPMGQKPCFLFLHHPVVHLPSVAAMLGLSTGKARRLGVHGGDRRGDDVFVDGCTALVLFAEEVDDASTGTDNSESSPAGVADHSLEPEPIVDALSQGLPLQLMPSADSSSPIGDVWGGGPQLTMEGVDLFDTTLPEGQSWNESFTAIHDRHEEVPSLADGHEESAPQIEPSRDMRTGDRVPHSLTRIAVLIYVPDFVPEILEVSVALPAAVEGLKGQVQAARPPAQSFSFPFP